MGRKSKAKKIIREQLQQPQEDKELKQAKKQPRFRINKKKLFGGILAVIMLAILTAVGYLIFEKAFRAQPIAKFLPTESTIAFLELNTNFDHNQLNKTFKLLENHPEYSKENLIKYGEKFFNLNYENDVKPWLGRQAGIAFINSAKEINSVYPLYFAEVLSQTNVTKFIEKYNPTQNIYIGNKTYTIILPNGPQYITFLGDYLFASPKEQAIFQLVDAQNTATEKLYYASKYRKVDSNIPLNRTAFAFLNFDQINDGFLNSLPIINKSGISMAFLRPLLASFDSEGAALIALEKDFSIQTFLSLDNEISTNASYPSFDEKYKADLANYLPKNTVALWGGENLELQLQKMLAVYAGASDSSKAIADQVLQNYSHKYFGQDTDFKEDIFPLLKGEFAFAIEKSNDKNVYKFIFELGAGQTDEVKIHELANNFANFGGVFEPKVVEHTLPDGTVGKEIVAAPEEIIRNQITHEGTTIYEMKMGKQNSSIFYTITNEVVIVCNDLESIRLSMNLVKSTGDSLSTTEQFIDDIKPVIRGSDEISYFDFKEILPLIFKNNDLPPVLNIISTFSSGKNYFDDGVVTINYLHIK